jgi:hypothetical protein
VSSRDLDRLYHEQTEFDVRGATAQRFEETLRLTERIFEAAHGKPSPNVKAKKKFKKLDVISAFLLSQDLTKNKLFQTE